MRNTYRAREREKERIREKRLLNKKKQKEETQLVIGNSGNIPLEVRK